MSKYATVRKPYDPRWLHGAGASQPDILHRLDGEHFDFWHPALPEVRVSRRVGFRHPWLVTECLAPSVMKDEGLYSPGCGFSRVSTALRFVSKAGHSALVLSLLLPAVSQAQEPCKVNVQTCKASECAYLPGIGPSKGAAIEAAHPADEPALDAVPGIGAATLAKIRPHVVYSGPTTCTSKQAAPTMPEGGTDGPKPAGKDGSK